MTARFSQGKYSLAISDRDGQAYPYNEMVREWTGVWVHISEYEPKSPQLEIKVTGGDPQALLHARTARTEFATCTLLPWNPFQTQTAATNVIRVNEPGHGRTMGDTYRFYGATMFAPGTGSTTNPVAQYADPPTFDGIEGSNIAKAATPNFKARDIDFNTELARHTRSGNLDVSNDKHLPALRPVSHKGVSFRQPLQQSLDGNTVELAVEQM